MSSEAFEKFRASVAADPALQQQCLALLQSGDVGQLLALAEGRGFGFTAQEIADALNGAELSDVELEMVAGGSNSKTGTLEELIAGQYPSSSGGAS